MNKSKVEKVAATTLIPKAIRGLRFSWLAYGAVMYFGIRYLNKKGILPKQTDAALDMVHKGLDYAKEQIGISSAQSSKASAPH